MRSWLPLVAVVLLISAGLWFAESPPQQLLGKRPTPQQQKKAADLIIRDARTRHFNEEGTLAYRVDADQITYFQFERRDRADLTEPRFLFYQAHQPKWRTESRSGVAHNNGERVVLRGDVKINELPEAGGIRLDTQAITIKPRQEYAETDKVVTITAGPNITSGKGLRAFLKEDRVEILSDVKSSYESK
ncbi:LPS export ABC transporter periplasmic protein LptC [Microbulbifer thermotolerans]|uniref:Lipopolysaccharide export system protein LptC n=1 Tax=Microbulbifer thermotolerans TaxID=252514 RepID=A0A143HKN6_MICTH|nr:LPS export ABC transporter periplasmic protein LptC [Microbulbifer thermotolerans]AMX02030.1 LPS export ABC transporter periplasmic protein LptC [Microbulbifer thermotolerans]MCX2780786.1 LPS export ABC transporter periplasmic protein LptC [Microbulbifer thermotolerans]MCX2783102.1 LPS export ABC transporter periplasmic protein LptC [Microbulbifer thermotolerans]MCX2794296.1 LPS export ABC transporter periplasmic protein LptC [Microbulbifer thermotolerans]MCX2800682.1 LPS export ABC transpo